MYSQSYDLFSDRYIRQGQNSKASIYCSDEKLHSFKMINQSGHAEEEATGVVESPHTVLELAPPPPKNVISPFNVYIKSIFLIQNSKVSISRMWMGLFQMKNMKISSLDFFIFKSSYSTRYP